MLNKCIFVLVAAVLKYLRLLRCKFYQFYNVQYLKWKGTKVGCNCVMNGKTAIMIASGATLEIGDNFICRSDYPNHILGGECSCIKVYSGGGVKIGHDSGISATNINCVELVTIGNHVLIGAGCLITDSNHHSIDWQDRCLKGDCNKKSAPVVIGDYVFVGAKSIILKGVTIGEKSIIAAGSVVVSDIPANCIAGGNPCKVIKYLI